MSESQFNYLFTLKNAHLSLNSYNFRMQPNIPMKFAGYVAWMLLCQYCKFGEKNYYNSGDIEFSLGDYFFWRALYMSLDKDNIWYGGVNDQRSNRKSKRHKSMETLVHRAAQPSSKNGTFHDV